MFQHPQSLELDGLAGQGIAVSVVGLLPAFLQDVGRPLRCMVWYRYGGVQILTYLLAVFSGLILSQYLGTPLGQSGLFLWVILSLLVQGIILTSLAVLMTSGRNSHFLSPFLSIYSHSLLSLLNSSLPLPPCVIMKTGKICCLVVGKSMYLLVIDYWYVGGMYTGTRKNKSPCITWLGANQFNAGQAGTLALVC